MRRHSQSLQPKGRSLGFTLIEVLVVILIVAVLLGLLLPAINALRRAAMVRKAAGQAIQLSNAIREYRTCYGKWPAQTKGDADTVYQDAAQAAVIAALTNNPREIAFLEIPEGVMSNGCYMDPWMANPYVIVMDENGDGAVTIIASKGAMSINTVLDNQNAAVFSWGRNPSDSANKRISSWEF